MKHRELTTKFLIILPFLLAVMVMLPRLLSPQFGFFDDGSMLGEMRRIAQGDLSMANDIQAGRFRPVYWLYFFIIYYLAGANPFWFFFGHLLVFLLLIIEIQLLMKYEKADHWQILISSLVFIFSVPIIENFYTLSKGEPIQLVFILGALLCIQKANSIEKKVLRWLLVTASIVFLTAGIMTKETTIVILPIAVFWAVFFYFSNKKQAKIVVKNAIFLFLGPLIAFFLYQIIRALWGTPSLTGGTYTHKYALDMLHMLENLARWATFYAFYFHYLIPLGILTAIILKTKSIQDQRDKQTLVKWIIWCFFWFAILLPWDFAKSYYLLPFSVGVSVFAGVLIKPIKTIFTGKALWIKWVATGLISISILLFLATFFNYQTNARVQLIFDKMNAKMLAYTSENLPNNNTIFVNFETRKEYVDEIEHLLIEQYRLIDIVYKNMSPETLGQARWMSDGIVLMPHVQNIPEVIVRAGVDNFFTETWNKIIRREMDDQLVLVSDIKEQTRLFNLNLPVAFCPLIGKRGFCEDPDPMLDTRIFEYGWEVYKIE